MISSKVSKLGLMVMTDSEMSQRSDFALVGQWMVCSGSEHLEHFHGGLSAAGRLHWVPDGLVRALVGVVEVYHDSKEFDMQDVVDCQQRFEPSEDQRFPKAIEDLVKCAVLPLQHPARHFSLSIRPGAAVLELLGVLVGALASGSYTAVAEMYSFVVAPEMNSEGNPRVGLSPHAPWPFLSSRLRPVQLPVPGSVSSLHYVDPSRRRRRRRLKITAR